MKNILNKIKNWVIEIDIKISRSFKAEDITREKWQEKHREARQGKRLVEKLAKS